MQKVVVARELAEQPKVLLVSQPTRGVDLGATQFIWRTITEARDAGAAVLLSSADLSELLALSDRLVVFYRGRIVAAFLNRDELTPEMLGAYMLGLSKQTPEEMRVALSMSDASALARTRWTAIRRESGARARRGHHRARGRLRHHPLYLEGAAGGLLHAAHRADHAGAHHRPVDRRRRQAHRHRARLQPGLPGPPVRDGRAGAGLCRRAGRELCRAVAASARPGSPSRSASSARWRRARSTASCRASPRRRLGANEIVSSLMLNYIAIELANYLSASISCRRTAAC